MVERVRVHKPRVRIKRSQPNLTLLDATNDPLLFAPWFKRSATWQAWFVFLRALFALPMTREQLALYQQCTGRSEPPSQVATEGWLVCGRRAGKSFILALVAVFLAAFHDYRHYLAPGERGTVIVIAADRKQARVIMRYVRALLTHVPMLARMVQRETTEAFDLNNRVSIEVGTASFRSTRGYTIIAALCDECAFWSNENSTEPDYEVLTAIRPGMSTIPNAMLLCASSPYARRGALWDAHRKHFGKDGDPVLVWQASTRVMNETVPQSVIDDAMERDPASAAAEFLAQFRSDIEAFVTKEAVEGCVSSGIFERPHLSDFEYVAFVDPSGGSADSMTLAVGHHENEVAVVDAIRERKPPFSPEDVVAEFAAVLKSYGIDSVTGDRYAGEWPRERFSAHGVTYEPASKPKSNLYGDLLPAINSKRVDLLDHQRLVNQLIGLERRTARGGKDSIDHAPGAHDDIANVVAGVVATLAGDGSNGCEWTAENLGVGDFYAGMRRMNFI